MTIKEAFKQEAPASIEALKAKGLELALEGLEDVAMEMLELFSRVAAASDTPIDNSYELFKGQLVSLADKIDGQEG